MREVKEINEVKEVKEKNGEVAAFFDLDRTLVEPPSLERRFIRMLRYRRAIPVRNYFLWLREAVRLLPRGINTVLHGNKLYLRGVQSFDERGGTDHTVFPGHKSGHQAEGQASALSSGRAKHNPRLPVPAFFEEGVEKVAWHARQEHAIVLVSGTLEPLASAVALALVLRLAVRGIASSIGIYATRLEEAEGKWTGRVVGEAMFGEAKAHAVRRFAAEAKLDLTKSYAYGDSANDQWLLAAVGNPAAVNPSRRLARLAKNRGWPVLHWGEERISTLRHKDPREREEQKKRKQTNDSVMREGSRESNAQLGHAERWI
ncbi:MAG TPA: HAD-IB family phosphatase [Candidatus Acidoferrum sp.]|nr:HAD-IB family phosphatase [Candidatus Acidoferrum sp.]